MQNYIKNQFETILKNIEILKEQTPLIEKAAKICTDAIKSQNKIIFCGNGGSAADAQHLSAELVGRYKKDRKPIASMALNTNTSALTAIANDYSFDCIFERQIEAIAKKGDVLVGISTSAKSKNVLLALEKAKTMGAKTIFLCGGNKSEFEVDLEINAPSFTTNNIQEMHIIIGHLICDIIEKELFEG